MKTHRLSGAVLCMLLSQHATAIAAVLPIEGASPQRAVALTPFANPIGVTVVDDAGAPVEGATVGLSAHWNIAPVGPHRCYLQFLSQWECQAVTDSNGRARFPDFRGEIAGTYEMWIGAWHERTNLGLARLQFTVDVLHAPAVFDVVSGGNQTVIAGARLRDPIVLQLRRADATPIPGARIVYGTSGSSGGHFDSASELVTDGDGIATLPGLTAGWGLGLAEVVATYVDYDARAYVSERIPFTVTNAEGGLDRNLQALWWSGPSENGWGMSVVQHRDQLFNVMFVYDDRGRPAWFVQPGGRWVDGLVGGQFTAPLYRPRGTPWHDYDASRFVVAEPVGQAMLLFEGSQKGTLYFVFKDARGEVTTRKEIVRQDIRGPAPMPSKGVADMWWGGPQQNGWGMAIHEQEGSLFIVWFTYDDAGEPTWFVMSSGQWRDADTYAGAIYRTRASAWIATTYDARQFSAERAGSFTLRFAGGNRAAFEYTLDGRSGVLEIERQPF